MNKIKIRLDKRCLIIGDDGNLTEIEYTAWPVDDAGNPLPPSECLWNGEKVIDNRLGVAKDIQKQKISEAFENNIAAGFFRSEALAIDVDYRRSGVKNDLQNVEALVSYMEKELISSVIYKGYEDQKAPANLQQLKSLIAEMQAFGVYLYNKKDALKSQIDAAETIEAVKNIVWG